MYEHEIRWARQELVIQGVIQTTRATGKGAWKLSDSSSNVAYSGSENTLSRMIDGFLDPDAWFLNQWLPAYEEAVERVKRSLVQGQLDDALEIIWMQQDNAVSHAGRGILAKREVDAHRDYFASITRDIARRPTPETFGEVLVDVERHRSQKLLSKVPRLLVARAFAAIAPERYHTTVDAAKHDRVIAWFETHTSFRGTEGNWAHKAAELSHYLSGIRELGDSVLIRNMFPWFVFTQLRSKNGRPAFTPGHRPRTPVGAGRGRVAIESTVLRHNSLVETLYAELVDEHGRTAVGTEQPSGLGGFVDAVVKRNDKRYWIYEVKVAATASDAIRQALGQLLEYGYREGAWNPERLYVVGEATIDAESKKFLSRLRADFGIPIEYRQVVAQ